MRQFDAEEVVAALYNGVLGRPPDPAGLKTYLELLAADPTSLQNIARHFHASEEHQRHSSQSGAIVDHSQFGEFTLFLKHLVKRSQNHGFIVDVGARGRERSNSFDLLKNFGWQALLIEANPDLWSSIEQDFSGTNYTLVKCAASTIEGTVPFFIGENDDVSSLGKEFASAWGNIRGEIQVTSRRLGSILDENNVPHDFDILSLDIEGLDVEVLNDLCETTDYRPELVCLETSANFRNRSLEDVGLSDDVRSAYTLAYQTKANMLLVRSHDRTADKPKQSIARVVDIE